MGSKLTIWKPEVRQLGRLGVAGALGRSERPSFVFRVSVETYGRTRSVAETSAHFVLSTSQTRTDKAGQVEPQVNRFGRLVLKGRTGYLSGKRIPLPSNGREKPDPDPGHVRDWIAALQLFINNVPIISIGGSDNFLPGLLNRIPKVSADTKIQLSESGGLHVVGARRWRWLLEWIGSLFAGFAAFNIVAMKYSLSLANADVLLGPVMSTQRLTFFYWGQDRLANVIPLLAFPVRDFSANFYVQESLMALGFFGLLGIVLGLELCRTGLLFRPMAFVLTLLVITLATMPLFGRIFSLVFTFEQIYAFSYFLLFMGVLLEYRLETNFQFRMVGAALVITSIIINPSLVLFIFVAGGLAIWEHRWKMALALVGLFSLGALLSVEASRRYGVKPGHTDDYNSFSFTRSLHNLKHVIHNLYDSVGAPQVMLILSVAILFLTLFRQDMDVRVWRLIGLMSAYSAGWIVLFSGSRWVEMNSLHFRYFFPIYLLMASLIYGGFGLAIHRLLGSARPEYFRLVVCIGWGAALLIASFSLPGIPKPLEVDAVRNIVPQISAGQSSRVDFVIGPYWTTWPAVFGLASVDMQVWGLAPRGETVLAEIRQHVTEASSSGRELKALCLEPERSMCASTLSWFLGGRWAVKVAAGTEKSVVVAIRQAP